MARSADELDYHRSRFSELCMSFFLSSECLSDSV
jgi:hypothetical protein